MGRICTSRSKHWQLWSVSRWNRTLPIYSVLLILNLHFGSNIVSACNSSSSHLWMVNVEQQQQQLVEDEEARKMILFTESLKCSELLFTPRPGCRRRRLFPTHFHNLFHRESGLFTIWPHSRPENVVRGGRMINGYPFILISWPVSYNDDGCVAPPSSSLCNMFN